jgi:hypothetical protein
MTDSIMTHGPQWKTAAPVPSQLTDIRMAIDQLWTKSTNADEELEELRKLVNTDISQSRLMSVIKGIFGHSSSMPDFKGENADHDQRYVQKSMLPAIANIRKINVKAAVELTIASGIITVVQSFNKVDTQSDAASDDLDTINGGVEGDMIFLVAAHTDRTVVLKHGTGNIVANAGTDFSLDSTSLIAVLIFDGTNWHLN